jgi:hypothetical protein
MTSFPDSVYSNINDIQTESMNYLSKYTALARCIQAKSTDASVTCYEQQTAFNIAQNETGVIKQNITNSLAALNNVSVPTTITALTYATDHNSIISENDTNRNSVSRLTSLFNSTFYLESKRETDAVIYAWTLWLIIFIITAIGVFSYM